MSVRTADDFYADLGIAPDASAAEVSDAFRAWAKQLHPDVGPTQPGADERFKRLSRAYAVLSDPVARATYDAQRAGADHGLSRTPSPPAAAPGPPAAASRGLGWSRRTASRARGLGLALVAVSLLFAGWVVALQRADADLRADGVRVEALAVDVDGERRVMFTTRDGEVVTTAERTRTGEAVPALGSIVVVHYDRDDPTRVISDVSHTGRDVTLWIVVAKLFLGGWILVGFAVRRLHQPT